MLDISVKSDIGKIVKAFGETGRNLKAKAIGPALNKTLAKGKTEMTRAITSEFAIKAAEVRPRLSVRKASANRGGLIAVMRPLASSRKGRSLNLIHFIERKVSLAEARRRGKAGTLGRLRFQIKKGGGLKDIKNAFIGNNGRTVFVREGDSRLPIKALQTIDIPQMFNTRRINARVVKRIQKEFPLEFERALRLLISKAR